MIQSCLNTYSIVARCPRSGEFGAAVATAVPAVGAICLYIQSGVGAVSTQSWVNPYLATAILEQLQAGLSINHALSQVLKDDPAANLRQLAAIGREGSPAVWTGSDCTQWCGHQRGDDYCAQGNMLTGAGVVEAMGKAFDDTADQPLDERLMCALEAAQKAGGDKRGRQSAALKVVGSEVYGRVDLRVDEHPDPVAELRRILEVARQQLAPFIDGMPKRGAEPAASSDEVVQLLMKSPPERPGGGGSAEP